MQLPWVSAGFPFSAKYPWFLLVWLFDDNPQFCPFITRNPRLETSQWITQEYFLHKTLQTFFSIFRRWSGYDHNCFPGKGSVFAENYATKLLFYRIGGTLKSFEFIKKKLRTSEHKGKKVATVLFEKWTSTVYGSRMVWTTHHPIHHTLKISSACYSRQLYIETRK